MTIHQRIGGLTDTTLHWQPDGTVVVEERQDAEPILEYAQAARNARFDADACGGMLRHEAEIPMVEYLRECRRIGVQPLSREADRAIENLLNDPLYARLRAAPKLIDPRIRIKGKR